MSKIDGCPNCGGKIVPALYGYPMGEIDFKEYLVMGCMIPEVMVDRGCRDCDYRVYVDGTIRWGNSSIEE